MGVAFIQAPKQGRTGSVTQPPQLTLDGRRDDPAECPRFVRSFGGFGSERSSLRSGEDEELEVEAVKAAWRR